MQTIILDAEAGQLSAKLARRGISSATSVHVVVEVEPSSHHRSATIAQAGGAFDWLADEPDDYSGAELAVTK